MLLSLEICSGELGTFLDERLADSSWYLRQKLHLDNAGKLSGSNLVLDSDFLQGGMVNDTRGWLERPNDGVGVDFESCEVGFGTEADKVVDIAKVVKVDVRVFNSDFDGLRFICIELKDCVVESRAVPPSLEGREDNELGYSGAAWEGLEGYLGYRESEVESCRVIDSMLLWGGRGCYWLVQEVSVDCRIAHEGVWRDFRANIDCLLFVQEEYRPTFQGPLGILQLDQGTTFNEEGNEDLNSLHHLLDS